MHATSPPPEDDGWDDGPADPGPPDLPFIDAILPAAPSKGRRSRRLPAGSSALLPSAPSKGGRAKGSDRPRALRDAMSSHPGALRAAAALLALALAAVLLLIAARSLPASAWLAAGPPAVLALCAAAWFRRRSHLGSGGSGAGADEH